MISPFVLKEGNWRERKGFAILTVALKKYWDGSDAETSHRGGEAASLFDIEAQVFVLGNMASACIVILGLQ